MTPEEKKRLALELKARTIKEQTNEPKSNIVSKVITQTPETEESPNPVGMALQSMSTPTTLAGETNQIVSDFMYDNTYDRDLDDNISKSSNGRVEAQNRERELRKKFEATKQVDHIAEAEAPFFKRMGKAFIDATAKAKFEDEQYNADPKILSAAGEIATRSFVHGLLPIDFIINPLEGDGFKLKDAVHNANMKAARIAGMDEKAAEGFAMSMEMAGSFGPIGGAFKGSKAGLAWAAGKWLPDSLMAGRKAVTFGEKAAVLGGRAALAGAIGVGYEGSKDELDTIKKATLTSVAWAGTDLVIGGTAMGAGAGAPYAIAGGLAVKNYLKNASLRNAAWKGIQQSWLKALEKIPMDWAFGGKYGPTLRHYAEPASSRLKQTPEGQQALDKIENLLVERGLVKERTAEFTSEGAKRVRDIPEGQRLVYYLMQMDPSSAEFWQVIGRIEQKYGKEAAENILTNRMLSREAWTKTGKAAVETPWYTKEEKGPKVWLPKPNAERVIPLKEKSIINKNGIPNTVTRVEEPGVEISFDKPHGLYTTPSDVESPFLDLGGKVTKFNTNPKAKVLMLSNDKTIPIREGAEDSGSGIHALNKILGRNKLDILINKSKEELVTELSKKYPKVEWNRYYDKQEILEALGGIKSREAGYDAIFLPDKDPKFSEYVALNKNAFTDEKVVPLAEQNHKDIAEKLGLTFNGMQERVNKPPVPMYTDPVTKSTLVVHDGETIVDAVNRIRSKFNAPLVEAPTVTNAMLKEGQAHFNGFEMDNDGKFVLNFSRRKLGSNEIDDVTITRNSDFKKFIKAYKISNKDEFKAAGKWKTTIKMTDVPLLKEETWLKNIEKYVPRIFEKYWKDLPADMQLYYQQFKTQTTTFGKREAVNMLGASANRFLKKHNLPQELVDALEPITDMCVLDYHGLVGARTAILTARTFDSLSRMPGICMDRQAFKAAQAAGKDMRGWVEVPNDVNRYFKLAGKMLQQDAFMELESLVLPAADAQGRAHRALIKWKGFHTIWSPRVHVRNSISNIMLNATVGDHSMPPWGSGWTAYKDMAQIMHNPNAPENAAVLKEMAEHKLFMGSFRQTDLASIAPALDTKVENVFDYLAKGYQHAESEAAKAYEAEEKWAKGAKYLYLRRMGIDRKAAAKEAMESTFNYSDLPLFVRDLRNKWWGAPFATFTYKAVPAMMESAVKYPWRIAAIEGAIYALNAVATNAVGMTKNEWDKLQKQLPNYMANGHYSPIPGRDSKGRIRWFDTSYLLPWGMIYTMREQTMDRSGARVPFIGEVILTNPLVSTASDIMRNEKFNGQPIVHSFDSWPTAMLRVLSHVWEQAVPSLMVGGSDFYSIVDTVMNPESEKSLTPSQQIAKQLGVGVRPMSEQQVKRGFGARRMEQIKEVKSELRQRIRKNPQNAKEERKKAQERLRGLLGK